MTVHRASQGKKLSRFTPEPAAGRHLSAKFACLCIVGALHIAILTLLDWASRPAALPPSAAERMLSQIVWVAAPSPKAVEVVVPMQAAPPMVPSTRRRSSAIFQPPALLGPTARQRIPVDATPTLEEPPAPEPAAVAAKPLDLSSGAVRRAIRNSDRNRQRSFAEQSNEALNASGTRPVTDALAQGVGAAKRPDCLRGESKPIEVNVGLGKEYMLRLPGVIRDLPRGDCASLNR